jgi:HPt (histidine-containing phosphotransfer) domain-containing protein
MQAQLIIDPITYRQLKEQIGADFIRELVEAYCHETGRLIEQLYQALAAQDSAAFVRLAHSIKSSSASLGALNFSQQARELELSGKTDDLSGAGPQLERLSNGFLQVKRCLEELRDEP